MMPFKDSLSNTTTSVTPTSSKRVGCTDNALVEEASAPDLAWDESSTQNTNEESQGDQAVGCCDKTRHGCWDGSKK